MMILRSALAFACMLHCVLTTPGFARSADNNQVFRFIEGIDQQIAPMSAEAVAAHLNDPWAVLVLRKGVFPNDILAALAALEPASVPMDYSVQHSFFVSESGQLPVNVAIAREFRLVITRSKPSENLPAVLFSAPAGSREGFIELMSWDATKKAMNFYRRTLEGKWAWKGDSPMAFRSATAGKGCFQCHVHGVPIMKELRTPWNNWHSQQASIPPEAIPTLEIRQGPLFTRKAQAEELELFIKGWISTVVAESVKHIMKGEQIPDAKVLLRPLFETDTANLQSSQGRSSGSSAKLDLPPGFFLNFDAFSNVFGLETLPNFSGLIDRKFYAAAVKKFAFRLTDGAGFSNATDTHFGFLVPVASESGTAILRQSIAQQLITRHFALSVLMVDFPNPVYSKARSRLLRYVPEIGHIQDGRSDLADRTAQAILAAAPSWTAPLFLLGCHKLS